ncbi:MAG TPA: glycosyltransferase family 2 protein [Thermoanaerobaculia bacterium]|nr:glycosyltransferase family 2 protein [Thermoanaerobaculia bacterium]
MDLSVVVPVFNSAGSLPVLARRLHAALEGRSFEIVLVNDGSRDDSWAVIQGLASGDAVLRGLNLMRNYGQHNALLAGIRAARGSVIVTIDDDLQHSPEDIPRLLAELERGADVVYGTTSKMPHSLFRNVASWVTKIALQKTMGAATARKVSAFRAFRTPLRNAFATYQSPYVSIDVLLTWATTRFSSVEVEHRPREIGASNYTFRTLLVHGLTMMTGFSTLPLRFATLVGFCVTLFGFAILAFVLVTYFINKGSAPGFPFLASIIAIFSGAQLFALGIIGEYLARVHVRLMERPAYTVGTTVGIPPER